MYILHIYWTEQVIHEPTGTVLSARGKDEVLKADELLKWNTACFEDVREKSTTPPRSRLLPLVADFFAGYVSHAAFCAPMLPCGFDLYHQFVLHGSGAQKPMKAQLR